MEVLLNSSPHYPLRTSFEGLLVKLPFHYNSFFSNQNFSAYFNLHFDHGLTLLFSGIVRAIFEAINLHIKSSVHKIGFIFVLFSFLKEKVCSTFLRVHYQSQKGLCF